MSITSDEVNFLVYRYLQESGFVHSSFTFGCESFIARSNINGANVAPGALITFLQKGLQYLEIEHQLRAEDSDDSEADEPISLLNAYPTRVKSKKKGGKKGKGGTGPEAMEEDAGASIIDPSSVTTLEGHVAEVLFCAWNPARSMLASGSTDSTARIWDISPPSSSTAGPIVAQTPLVLNHQSEGTNDSNKDVTTLDWNKDGTLLATGSIDGAARVWDSQGTLLMTLKRHTQPIFSLKWNRSSTYLLSGSVDTTAIVWDARSGNVKQQFQLHTASTLDVDWRNDYSFATCSADKYIYVCEIGQDTPVKRFEGHTDEVNAIKWDPTGTMLASCSDDSTAKIWSLNSDRCIHNLQEHTKEVYTIKWSPTGPGTDYPSQPLVLATASFDSTVKLWDAFTGTCKYTLAKHKDPVYSIAFSPTGEFLASGASDQCLYIWSVKDGSLVRSLNWQGGIFEVSWDSTGSRVAACFSNNTIAIVDLRL